MDSGGGAEFRPPGSAPSRRPCASVPAFPKAVLAPSAILQPLQPLQPPPKMLLLLPEAGRPALSPGHSPPSGAPGPPAGVRTTCLPSPTPALPTASPSAPTRWPSTPVPSVPLLGTLRPPSQLQDKAVVTPSLPRGPTAPQPAPGPSACRHLGATYESGSQWTEPGCSQCWCEVGVRGLGAALLWCGGLVVIGMSASRTGRWPVKR